jgi:hypothetical protein
MAFSDNIAQMTGLLQKYFDNRGQFGSEMGLCANYPRCVSIAGRQLDTGPFIDFVKRMEAFPQQRAPVKGSFVISAI